MTVRRQQEPVNTACWVQAIERDMHGRKVKASRRKGDARRRKPSSSFRIVRPDTGYTAGDKNLQVRQHDQPQT